MTRRIKKRHPALRHAGYSVTTILPGENAAEFEKLHRDLISEWSPDGTLDEETVATLARLVWRRRNLHTFYIAELARKHVAKLQESVVPDPDLPGSAPSTEVDKLFIEKLRAAESQARTELGDLYALVEMGEEATVDRLMKNLELQERIDAMIDKCLKRLLFVRGLKSISLASAAVPQALPGPSRVG